MNQSLKSMLPDHEEQFSELFNRIEELIHQNNLSKATELLTNLHYADLADFLDNSNQKIYKEILPLIASTINPKTLVFINDSNQQVIIDALGINLSASLLEQLDIEDIIEVVENLDEETKQDLIPRLSKEKQTQLLEGFNYPEDTAGRIMERNYIAFKEYWSIKDAIEYIKEKHSNRNFHAALVVNNRGKPIGSILLSSLLKYDISTPIKDIMNNDIQVVDSYTELSEISFIFKQYALTIVPVINKTGKLIGTISIDNMIYIIEEQAEKDIMQLGGIYSQDTFYNLFTTAKKRFPWLFINLITACITSIIISHYNTTIAKLIPLAAIMPIVAALGGNAGTQAMTVTIRALSNKDITKSNMSKVVSKEILVCGLNGLVLSLIGMLLCVLITHHIPLSMIFGIAIILNFLIAGFFGSITPITLYQLDIDPATASGVFLTALTDAFGFFTFLTLAYVFLV